MGRAGETLASLAVTLARMPMTECKIDLDLALTLRALIKATTPGTNPPRKNLFRCVECGKPVFPQGGENKRFTHWEKNPHCSG